MSEFASASASEQLYQKRVPIHTRSVSGRFRMLKTGILLLAYGVFFLTPWLRWERSTAADQAVLFDIPGRTFYIFNLVVSVQDIFWLAGFLIIAAMTLFFVTGLAGRVFCGYFCFQTLWTDAFMYIERWVQGERPARIRLDKAPWTTEKLIKKGTTLLLWLLFAFWSGLTFTLYWADAPTLVTQFFTLQAPGTVYFTTALLTTTTFVMAGLAREQVCTYMCPYARFQSAMFDHDTLIVSYDARRGEGKAGRAKVTRDLKTRDERQANQVGDCIDCGYCVQVCPTGIDIRNGLQYQCISCALCIDACDTIMDKMGWPRGLVRYTSENALEGRKVHWVKPRSIGYAVIITIAASLLLWSILNRAPYTALVAQIRQPLAVTLSDGSIQNSYEVKLNNKLTEPMAMDIGLVGLEGAQLQLVGRNGTTVELDPQQRVRVLVRVRMPVAGHHAEREEFSFVIDPAGDIEPTQRASMFYYP